MSNILGLDLGPNSIGWAIVNNEKNKIVKSGVRIIPMDEGEISNYDKGNLQSKAHERTAFRLIRRNYERSELRRERLIRVLCILGFLPEHYRKHVDPHTGKFLDGSVPLPAYRVDEATGKHEFIFKSSFAEMIDDFRRDNPDRVSDGKKIPYDWTLYYLRKKALSSEITREELAWILLNANTKRGYYQLRGEDVGDPDVKKEFRLLKVIRVEKKDENVKQYSIQLDGYDVPYTVEASSEPFKVGEILPLIVTSKKKGSGAKAKETISFAKAKEEDWMAVKATTEQNIKESKGTVGEYIYSKIKEGGESGEDVKIRGGLVSTIERKYYREELKSILEEQSKYIPQLRDKEILRMCAEELYAHNEQHRNIIMQSDMLHFLLYDVIYYQRPLKSKKGEIAECPLERIKYRKDGEIKTAGRKCMPRSNPYFEDFRLWQRINDLKIIEKMGNVDGKIVTQLDVTEEMSKHGNWKELLFREFRYKEYFQEKEVLSILRKNGYINKSGYNWNYPEDEKYPAGPVHYYIYNALAKVDKKRAEKIKEQGIDTDGKTDIIYELWHLLYSVVEKEECSKALRTFARKHSFPEEEFAETFSRIKQFDDGYASYSERAVRKLIPLMSSGHYWSEERIPADIRERIRKILDGEVDDRIPDDVRERIMKSPCKYTDLRDFHSMRLDVATALVYGNTADTSRWTSPEDIDLYLRSEFRQNSLRNPVVEAVIRETLAVVRDLWHQYGKMSEIHIELARDLKQNKKQRIAAKTRIDNNRDKNFRIRNILEKIREYDKTVRPYSPSHIEKLRIFLEKAMAGEKNSDYSKIYDKFKEPQKVSSNDVKKYYHWLDQRYTSPYTGKIIRLSELFTEKYQIDHIIPRARYFDDTPDNKVVCEADVNREKGKMTAYKFIMEKGGNKLKSGDKLLTS